MCHQQTRPSHWAERANVVCVWQALVKLQVSTVRVCGCCALHPSCSISERIHLKEDANLPHGDDPCCCELRLYHFSITHRLILRQVAVHACFPCPSRRPQHGPLFLYIDRIGIPEDTKCRS
jgi:hypothetical protein